MNLIFNLNLNHLKLSLRYKTNTASDINRLPIEAFSLTARGFNSVEAEGCSSRPLGLSASRPLVQIKIKAFLAAETLRGAGFAFK